MPNKSKPTYEELAQRVFDMSDVHGPNRQVINAIGIQIQANGKLDSTIKEFMNSTTKTERVMIDLATAQKHLAIAQVVLAAGAIVAAIIFR